MGRGEHVLKRHKESDFMPKERTEKRCPECNERLYKHSFNPIYVCTKCDSMWLEHEVAEKGAK